MELRMKVCKICEKTLYEELFNRNKTKKDGLEIYCKDCSKIKSQKAYEKGKDKYLTRNKQRYLENREEILKDSAEYYKKLKSTKPELLLLRSAKHRAKAGNFPIDITIEDIKIPEFCPILKMKLEVSTENAAHNSPSLDKIIPELGYIKGNVQVISNLANTMKWNATFEQLINFAEWVNKEIKPINERKL